MPSPTPSSAAPPASGPAPLSRVAVGGLIALALLWCALLLVADAVILGEIRRKLFDERTLAEAPGRILESRVDERRGDDVTYDVAARYEFEVDGVRHEGDTSRLGLHRASSRADAEREVERLRPGAKVRVIYAPRDPTLSSLRLGRGISEWFALFMLIPFHSAGIGLVAACVSLLRARRLGPDDPGRRVIDEGDRIRLSLAPLPPWGSACVAAAIASFVLMIVIGLWNGLAAQPWLVPMGYAALGAVAIAVYIRARRRAASGQDDLVIDRRERRVLLPAKAGATERPACAVADVAEVVVSRREEKDSDGDLVKRFEPALRLRSAQGDASTLAIALVGDEADARRIARWTEARLREAGAKLG